MPRRRAALARAKRVEALTSHAVACLAVGAVFRVLMWLKLLVMLDRSWLEKGSVVTDLQLVNRCSGC